MSKDIDEKIWNQCRERAKGHWKELTDDEINNIQGNREKFVKIVQERYLITAEEAEKQFDDFKAECEIT